MAVQTVVKSSRNYQVINRIARERFNQKTLDDAVDRDAIPEKLHGSAIPYNSASSSGIASPLTEKNNLRTYHETPVEFTSSDGLFVFEYLDIASTEFADDNGATVVVNYDDPET